MDRLLEILHPDVVFTSDGGGIVTAARKPLEGADRVARAMASAVQEGAASFAIVDVNGEPGVLGLGRRGPDRDGLHRRRRRIIAIDIQRNPEKLRLP